MRIAKALIVALGLVMALPTAGWASTAKEVVSRATFAVDEFLHHLEPGDPMRVYVQNAFAVIVVPGMVRGGFILGFEHGFGAMMVRDTVSGNFGPPAFVEIFSGSLGIQAGGQMGDAILTVMNPAAVERLLQGDVRLGAEAGISVARIGVSLGAATTGNFSEDVYVFQRTAGLFGGLALNGGGIVPQDTMNRDYWGAEAVPAQIVRNFDTYDTRSDDLRAKLLRF